MLFLKKIRSFNEYLDFLQTEELISKLLKNLNNTLLLNNRNIIKFLGN